jgi:hypothetical protein
MTKLSDTQLSVLTAASRREDGAILPLPKNLKGGAATKVVDALISKGCVERIAAGSTSDNDFLKITRQGLDAINADLDKEPKSPRNVRSGTKQAVLIDMLRREEGATIKQIVEATGWQKHTVRGAISGALKKKLGLTVISEKIDGGERVYRIPA